MALKTNHKKGAVLFYISSAKNKTLHIYFSKNIAGSF